MPHALTDVTQESGEGTKEGEGVTLNAGPLTVEVALLDAEAELDGDSGRLAEAVDVAVAVRLEVLVLVAVPVLVLVLVLVLVPVLVALAVGVVPVVLVLAGTTVTDKTTSSTRLTTVFNDPAPPALQHPT